MEKKIAFCIKKARTIMFGLLWYLQESNQGHMDFQSIALPTELRYLAECGCKYRTIFNLSKTNNKKNLFVPSRYQKPFYAFSY